MRCSACGGENAAGAKFCSQCGRELSAAAKPNCPACGGAVGPEERFCPACGAALKEIGDYRRWPKSAPWAALGLAVAGLIFIFVFVTSQSRPPQSSSGGAAAGPAEPALPQLTETEMAKLPKDFGKLVEQGNHYFDHRQFHDAMVLYRKALEIDSSDLDVRTDLAACLNFLGDFNGAKVELEKVLARQPEHVVATFNMGVVQINLGQTGEAKRYWSKYLKLDPASPRAAEVKKLLSEMK